MLYYNVLKSFRMCYFIYLLRICLHSSINQSIRLQIATVVNSIAIISVIVIASTIELSSQGTNITLVNILLGIKCIQGVASAIIPTGLNSITLGVVGLSNFTHQHTLNRMYAHLGSACIVLVMSLLGSWLYTERGGGGEGEILYLVLSFICSFHEIISWFL